LAWSTFSEFKQLTNCNTNLENNKNIITTAVPLIETKKTGHVKAVAGDRDVYYMYFWEWDGQFFDWETLPRIAEITPGRKRIMDADACGEVINYYGIEFYDLVCLNKRGLFLFRDKTYKGIVIQYMYKELADGDIRYSFFPNLDTNNIEYLHICGTPDGKYIFVSYMPNVNAGVLGLVKLEIVNGGTDIIVNQNIIPTFDGTGSTGWIGLHKFHYYNGYIYAIGEVNTGERLNPLYKYIHKFDANTLEYLGHIETAYGELLISTKDKITFYQDKVFVCKMLQIHKFNFQTGVLENSIDIVNKYGSNGAIGVFGISQ